MISKYALIFLLSFANVGSVTINRTVATCEIISDKFWKVSDEFKKNGGADSKLIVISSSARGEKKEKSSKRDSTAIWWLVNFGEINSNRILIARGLNYQDNESRLEFYINGKLIETITLGKNGELCFSADN